jgi:hypothetical protein
MVLHSMYLEKRLMCLENDVRILLFFSFHSLGHSLVLAASCDHGILRAYKPPNFMVRHIPNTPPSMTD